MYKIVYFLKVSLNTFHMVYKYLPVFAYCVIHDVVLKHVHFINLIRHIMWRIMFFIFT